MKYHDEFNSSRMRNTLGGNIRKYRMLRGWTQKELAEQTNKSESAIRNYELGNRVPDQETVELISQALSLKSDYLYAPNPENCSSAFNILQRFESLYGLVPKMVDGDLHLVFVPPSEDSNVANPINKYVLKQNLLRWCQIRDSFKSGEYSEDDYYTWLLSDGVVKNTFSDFKGYPLPLEDKIENEKTRRGWGLYPSPVYDEDNNLILPLPEDEKPTE